MINADSLGTFRFAIGNASRIDQRIDIASIGQVSVILSKAKNLWSCLNRSPAEKAGDVSLRST
jgi:hypothetical protein